MSHSTDQMTPAQRAFYGQLEAAPGGINAKDVSDQSVLDALIALGAVEVTAEGKVVALPDEDEGEEHGAERVAHEAAVQPKTFAGPTTTDKG